MGSGFDNSIYWILSHVVTTIRYYTFKIAVLTIELPSWRILSNSLHCFLYRHGPPTETHQLLSNGYHILLSGVSTHALPSSERPIVAHSSLWYVFTGLLPSNRNTLLIVGQEFAFAGTCLPSYSLATDLHGTLLKTAITYQRHLYKFVFLKFKRKY
jgi:hypothetical protein